MNNRTAAAVIVIILISSFVCSSKAATDKRLELDLEDDQPSISFDQLTDSDTKTLKDALQGCPLCDSSVYSYCDFKIYHDACCCGLSLPQCAYQQKPCQFLHANTCQEHHLITRCCCYNPYRKLE